MKKSPISESFLKNHNDNKISFLYQSTWSNRTSFLKNLCHHVSQRIILFHLDMVRLIFLHGMARVRIIRSQQKELWLIRSGGQSTNKFFIRNIYGSWKHIRGIAGSFIWEGSIINGNGRYIQSQDTTIIWKGIIEAIINRPIVILSC